MTSHITALVSLGIIGFLRWRGALEKGEATAILYAIATVLYVAR